MSYDPTERAPQPGQPPAQPPVTPPVPPAYGQAPQPPYSSVPPTVYSGPPSSPEYSPMGQPPPPANPYGQPSSPGYPPMGQPANPYGQPSSPGYPPMGQPSEQPWGAVPLPYGAPQGTPPKKKSKALLITIIIVVVVLILGGGGGFAVYQATRPKPVITVTSKYLDGSTAVGATSTDGFTIKGTDFTHNSAITFYTDGKAFPSDKPILSDSNGAVAATLSVGPNWTPGFHNLTAKDADGYATKASVKVEIVVAGKNNTPGPNGAPTDAANMVVTVAITVNGNSTTETLVVKNGSVCRSEDDGQPHSSNSTESDGSTVVETVVKTCTGSYAGGKLTYIENFTSDKATSSNGVTCSIPKPLVAQHLEGSFSNGTTVSGTFSSDAYTAECDHGIGSVPFNAESGTWTGVAVVS